MKQRILLLVMLLACQLQAYVVNAQATEKPVYHGFVAEGKRWNCFYVNSNPNYEPQPCYYYMQGDTVISGHACKKMYVEHPFYDYHGYHSAFYEEGGKVYCYSKGQDYASLLFDFSCKEGESWNYYGHEIEVVRIDTIEGSDYRFRYFYVLEKKNPRDYDPSSLTILIDGIGGNIYNMFTLGGMGGGAETLYNCEQDGEEFFSAAILTIDDFKSVINWFEELLTDRVTNGLSAVRNDADALHPEDALVYDLQGRLVTTERLKPGIYVRQGRKFVIK